MTRPGITLLVAALLLHSPAARSAPLDKDGCAKLKAEQGELEHAGARGSMGKGPQWAKTNLAPDKLDQIRRLLEVDGQLQFRCRGRPLVNLPKDPDPDPAAREPESKKDGTKKGPTTKAAKAEKKDATKKETVKSEKKEAVKKAAAPPDNQAAKGDAKGEPEAKKAAATPMAPSEKPDQTETKTDTKPENKTAQKATAKKAKSKPKVDDAYRAPATDPGADPFAKQITPKQ